MIAPGPRLLLDASSPRAIVAVWADARWRAFITSEGPAVETLFDDIARALRDAGTPLSSLSGYFFASGPGSILGLRAAAMALRSWNAAPGLAAKPVLAFDSFALASALLRAEGRPEATIFAAARRDRWNALPAGSDRRVECDGAELAAMRPPFLRLSSRLAGPAPVDAENFDLAASLKTRPEVFLTPGLLHETTEPDAANLANDYAAWSGERHRA